MAAHKALFLFLPPSQPPLLTTSRPAELPGRSCAAGITWQFPRPCQTVSPRQRVPSVRRGRCACSCCTSGGRQPYLRSSVKEGVSRVEEGRQGQACQVHTHGRAARRHIEGTRQQLNKQLKGSSATGKVVTAWRSHYRTTTRPAPPTRMRILALDAWVKLGGGVLVQIKLEQGARLALRAWCEGGEGRLCTGHTHRVPPSLQQRGAIAPGCCHSYPCDCWLRRWRQATPPAPC